jgi:hypothetical protein
MARIRTQHISRGDVTADLSRQISRSDVTFSGYTPHVTAKPKTLSRQKSLSPLPGIEQPFLSLPALRSVAAMTEIFVFRGKKQTRALILSAL